MKLNEKEKMELVLKTLDNLKSAGKSDATIINYKYALIRFLSKCNQNKNLAEYTEEDIMEYMKKEYLSKNAVADTYNSNLAAIKRMFIVCYKKTFLKELLPSSKMKKNYLHIFLKKILSKYLIQKSI